MQFKDIGKDETPSGQTCKGKIEIKVSEDICRALAIEGAVCNGGLVVEETAETPSKLRAKLNAWLRIITMLLKVEEVI